MKEKNKFEKLLVKYGNNLFRAVSFSFSRDASDHAIFEVT